MAALVDLLLELGRRTQTPDALESELRERLDPALLDRLSAFSAARNIALSQVVLWAVECFTLTAAEEAWRRLADEDCLPIEPPPPRRLASTVEMPADSVMTATISATNAFFILSPEMES